MIKRANNESQENHKIITGRSKYLNGDNIAQVREQYEFPWDK